MENFLEPLSELESKCDRLQDKGESKPAHIQERVETIRVSRRNNQQVTVCREACSLIKSESHTGGWSWDTYKVQLDFSTDCVYDNRRSLKISHALCVPPPLPTKVLYEI